MDKRSKKKFWMIPAFAMVFAIVICICWKANVFGKFVAQDPYVAQDESGNDVNPESAQVIVTSEGSNQKGKDGSGNLPCSEKVPTCIGKKGTETNPFVILEIVPSHEQQQLCYFAGDEESGLPFNPIAFSRKILPDGEKNYTKGMSVTDLGIPDAFGAQWLTNNSYTIYEIGSAKKTKSVKLSEVGKYYTVEYTNEDIKKIAEQEGKDPEQVVKNFSDIFNNGNGNIADLAKEFPYLFEKDTTKETVEIDKEAFKDDRNWKKSSVKKGYLVVAGEGTGDFSFDGWNVNKDDWNASNFHWVYSSTKPSSGKDLFHDYGLQQWKIQNVNKDVTRYQGDYVSLSDLPYISSNGAFEEEQLYRMEYYGLKFNDILKRSLFTFTSEKEYKDFHLKVIAMTPDELNQISQKDDDEKVDMIERADMFFIQSGYSSETSGLEEILGTPQLYKIYNQWVKGNADYSYNKDKDAVSFYDTDLEWSSVMKIIKRVSENPNLPLMFNKSVGTMLNVGVRHEGEEDVCMYVTSENTHMEKSASLNNIAKLFLVSTQFDLLARKANGYTATFMEDIYPNLQQISLDKNNIRTAKQTGYYKRKEAIGCSNEAHNDVKYQNRANYLWNACTFYPEVVPWSTSGGMFQKGDDVTNQLVSYGYFESYLTIGNANPFMNHEAHKAEGATIHDTEKNVTVIGSYLANTNESTLLHPDKTNDDVASDYLSIVAHTILNSLPNTVADMGVQVLKQKREYVKVSDTSILLDYTSDKKYTDETSYVKISVNANGNNLPGVITKIVLKKEDDEIPLKLYSSKEFTDANLCDRETYTDTNRITSGYRVEGSLIGYVPYSLKDWADGYTTIEITTVGRILRNNSDGTNRTKAGDDFKTEISIGERTLFNLA